MPPTSPFRPSSRDSDADETTGAAIQPSSELEPLVMPERPRALDTAWRAFMSHVHQPAAQGDSAVATAAGADGSRPSIASGFSGTEVINVTPSPLLLVAAEAPSMTERSMFHERATDLALQLARPATGVSPRDSLRVSAGVAAPRRTPAEAFASPGQALGRSEERKAGEADEALPQPLLAGEQQRRVRASRLLGRPRVHATSSPPVSDSPLPPRRPPTLPPPPRPPPLPGGQFVAAVEAVALMDDLLEDLSQVSRGAPMDNLPVLEDLSPDVAPRGRTPPAPRPSPRPNTRTTRPLCSDPELSRRSARDSACCVACASGRRLCAASRPGSCACRRPCVERARCRLLLLGPTCCRLRKRAAPTGGTLSACLGRTFAAPRRRAHCRHAAACVLQQPPPPPRAARLVVPPWEARS